MVPFRISSWTVLTLAILARMWDDNMPAWGRWSEEQDVGSVRLCRATATWHVSRSITCFWMAVNQGSLNLWKAPPQIRGAWCRGEDKQRRGGSPEIKLVIRAETSPYKYILAIVAFFFFLILRKTETYWILLRRVLSQICIWKEYSDHNVEDGLEDGKHGLRTTLQKPVAVQEKTDAAWRRLLTPDLPQEKWRRKTASQHVYPLLKELSSSHLIFWFPLQGLD